MNRRTIALFAALVALAGQAAVFGQQGGAQAGPAPPESSRAAGGRTQVRMVFPYSTVTALINRPVVDRSGGPRATIRDAYLSASGLVTHWLLTLQGQPGLPDGDYAVPVYILQAQVDRIVLDDQGWPAGQCFFPARTAKSSGAVAALSVAATQLLRYRLLDGQGRTIGTLRDVVLNLQNHEVVYVAMDLGRILQSGERLFAVPFSEIWYSLSRGTVTIHDLDLEALRRNPGFSPGDWPETAGPSVVRGSD